MKTFKHPKEYKYLCPHSKKCDGFFRGFRGEKPCCHNIPHSLNKEECDTPMCNGNKNSQCKLVEV